ncbi:unnamed protein product [Tilletia controversa]|nr:unnamed protein product [Tilletia controversa]CAD6972604.1 unnamed protein product [Tilletia controversa]
MDEHPPPAPAPTYDWVPESAAQHDAFMDISGGWYSEEPPALASYITQTSTGNDPIDSELQRRLQMVITALNANPLRTRADVRSAQNTALLITALVECRYGIDKIPQRRGVGVSCEEDGVDETGSSRIALVVSEQKLQSLPSITGPLSRLDFSSPEIPHDTWSMLLDCTHQRGNGSFEEASVYRGEVMDLAVGLQRRAWPKTAIETFVQISLDVFEIAEDGRRSVRRKLVEESKAALPPHIIFLAATTGSSWAPVAVFMDTNLSPHPVSDEEHWDDDMSVACTFRSQTDLTADLLALQVALAMAGLGLE